MVETSDLFETKAPTDRMQEMGTANENTQVQTKNLIPPGLASFLWVLFNAWSFCGSFYIVIGMVSGWILENYKTKHDVLIVVACLIHALFIAFMYWVHHMCRDIPYRLVGGKVRALIETLILGSAIILRIYYPFDGSDYKNIGLLVLVTFQMHCWGQSMHLSWDIDIEDVVVHALVQFGIYMSGYLTCIILTFIVSVVIWVRFVDYLVPLTPQATQKEMVSQI